MADNRVYLFWNKDRDTNCREVLLSGDTVTTSLQWDPARNHFATNECIATGRHTGMVVGNDFEPVKIESFVVAPSATCLYIQIRTELTLPDTDKPPNATKHSHPIISLPPTPLRSVSDDYYDHLVEEDYYKVPKDLLRDDIYQVPSNLPVFHFETATLEQSPDSVTPDTPLQNGTESTDKSADSVQSVSSDKVPLFQLRHHRVHNNAGMQGTQSAKSSQSSLPCDTKLSSPLDCPTSPRQPVATPRPRKVKEGLDISVEIPIHYDTCGNKKVVKKQVSECNTKATEPDALSPVLSLERTGSTPLRPHRHLTTKRPHTSGPILDDPTAAKEFSSPCKIPSQLSVTHSPSEDKFSPSLPPQNGLVSYRSQDEPSHTFERVKSDTEEATHSEECSLLSSEVKSLKRQLSELKIEHAKVLGGEACVRQRLEMELKSSRQECVHLESLLEKMTNDFQTTSCLLKEQRDTCQNLRCEILELKKKAPEKPKILKKPILPKPGRKV